MGVKIHNRGERTFQLGEDKDGNAQTLAPGEFASVDKDVAEKLIEAYPGEIVDQKTEAKKFGSSEDDDASDKEIAALKAKIAEQDKTIADQSKQIETLTKPSTK